MLRIAVLMSALAGPAFAECSDILSITDWSFTQGDRNSDTLEMTVTSSANAPIRMVNAAVTFTDALGGEIGLVMIDRDAAIPAGGTYEQSRPVAADSMSRLSRLRKDEVRVDVDLVSVLYDDGTIEECR